MTTYNNRRQLRQRIQPQLPLDAFPVEIICEIMKHLEYDSLINISSTCKLFQDIADKYFDCQKVAELAKKFKKLTDNHSEYILTKFYENKGKNRRNMFKKIYKIYASPMQVELIFKFDNKRIAHSERHNHSPR